MLSQKHESIELIFRGCDRVAWGVPTSPDGDGDTNILYKNGDTFDGYELKPHHGIRWGENKGDEQREFHRLADPSGVHRAFAGDFDGDAEFAAFAPLSERLFERRFPESEFASVAWLEQVRSGTFDRHRSECDACRQVALELGDIDGDGRIGLAVGNFQTPVEISAVMLWERGIDPANCGGDAASGGRS